MFVDSPWDLWRTILVGSLTYLALIVILRITGKRTLSKLNVFDFIITIALGSTVATILLSSEVSLAEGITAILLLTILQFVITYLSVRIPWFRSFITDRATLVFHHGQFLHHNMKQVRITESEILQAIRNQGIGSLDRVDAVVLETNGVLNVIKELGKEHQSTIKNVKH